MHDKFCIIDGKAVWTGSTNITENGLFRNDNNAVVVASAELAANFSGEFSEMFADKKFGPRSPRGAPHPVVVLDGVTFETYFAPEDNVRREILDEIGVADRTIDFMAFSFTSDEIAKAMAKRIDTGVTVRGIFESRNAGSRYSDDEFLTRSGAQIRMDRNPYAMHNKVIIIDAETVITGSYNLSNNAENDNDENVLIIHSPAVAERYTRQFGALFN
jgi:phosphatidylserine/phosphatidylglycerophosphate/cardiolipin synthase-like enzyme